VESVAWVTERKDVLSGLFFMLTLLAYAGYARRPPAALLGGGGAGHCRIRMPGVASDLLLERQRNLVGSRTGLYNGKLPSSQRQV